MYGKGPYDCIVHGRGCQDRANKVVFSVFLVKCSSYSVP
jgi:hypothetical protein